MCRKKGDNIQLKQIEDHITNKRNGQKHSQTIEVHFSMVVNVMIVSTMMRNIMKIYEGMNAFVRKCSSKQVFFLGFTILPIHPHPVTPSHTQPHPVTSTHTHPHPVTPTQTQSHTPTPTHKNALKSHTQPQISCKETHPPINVFQTITLTHKYLLERYTHS